MFQTKSRKEQLTEQLQHQSESRTRTAATVADQLRERIVPAVGQATENAREWARPRVEHGIEVAAPRLESAVSGLAPRVDTARDKIVDELIPRLSEAISAWAAATAAAKDEAVSRGQGAASVMSGDAVASPKGRKKKRVLLGLGLLAGIVAGAMAVMKKSAPKDDPWTTPLADSYGATPNGRHSAGSPVTEDTSTAKMGSELTDSIKEADKPGPVDTATDADLDDAIKDLTDKVDDKADDTVKNVRKTSRNKNSASKNGNEKDGTDTNPAT